MKVQLKCCRMSTMARACGSKTRANVFKTQTTPIGLFQNKEHGCRKCRKTPDTSTLIRRHAHTHTHTRTHTHLEVVGWHGAREVLEAALVAERGARRRVADLWNLEQAQQVRHLSQNVQKPSTQMSLKQGTSQKRTWSSATFRGLL